MQKRQVREIDFKIGRFHGKFLSKNNKSEAYIRQIVFLGQRLKLWRTNNNTPIIRIFGYEVPLRAKCSRGECVDLMGYDEKHNLYLIELKRELSSDDIANIAKQINGYEKIVKDSLCFIEKEFEKEYFFPMEFKQIKKIILAPKEFYKRKRQKLTEDTIEYAYFGDMEIHKREIGEIINIHLVRKMK
jgi:hypothetical protein